MSRLRTPTLLLALSLAAAACGAGAWQRQIQFAKQLSTLQYYDIADIVLERVEKDPRWIGIIKSDLLEEIGDYYTSVAQRIATTPAGIQGFIDALHKANASYRKHIAHKSTKPGDRFEARLQVSRNSRAIAKAHLQLYEEPGTPKGEREKHKKQGLDLFKNAIQEFKAAAQAKEKEVQAKKKQKPKDLKATKAREKWEKEYDAVREEYFRLQLEHLNARVEYVKALKDLKAPAKQWQAELKTCAEGYKQLLLDFVNTPGEIQANLYLGICLMEQGKKSHKEALLRFDTVWRKRDMFRDYKRIPCQAAYHRALILREQKKYGDTINTVDALLHFASEGVWDVQEKGRTPQNIIDTLRELEGVDREQFGQREAAEAFMLQAKCLAAIAAGKKDDPKEQQKLYGAAYDIANAVGELRGLRDPKDAARIEKWRRLGKRPRSPVVIRSEYLQALQDKDYARAARLYTELLAQGAVPRDQLRQAWFTVGQCYHAAGRYYQAGIVFRAVSLWFPEPRSGALEAARAAVGAQAKQVDATDSEFDEQLLLRYRMAEEKLDVTGTQNVTILRARDLRKEGKFAQALELLGNIDAGNPAHLHALYETAMTHKARFEALAEAQKKGSTGKRVLSEMIAAFQKLLDYYRATAPRLAGEEHAQDRERLIAITAAGLLMLTDAYLRPYLHDPSKAIQLTDDLAASYPGIHKAPSAGALYMKRMHAAYILVSQAKSAQAATAALPVIEQSWKVLTSGAIENFQYLDRAAAIGAHAHLRVAEKYEAEAKQAQDPEARKALTARAEAARHRGIELYVELLRTDPKQDLKTYRYVIHNLEERGREEDYKVIVELAPKALARYAGAAQAAEDVRRIKTDLGFAHYGLRQYAEAIPYLREIEDYYESRYQKALAEYERQKEAYERDPGAFRQAPSPPRRSALQPEVKEKLAYCYLATNQTDQYAWCIRAYADLLRIHRDPAKLWAIRYNLCETNRRLDNYGEPIKLVDRWYLRDATLGGPTSKRRFQFLIQQIIKDIEKDLQDPPDPTKKDTLEYLKAEAERVYKQLRSE